LRSFRELRNTYLSIDWRRNVNYLAESNSIKVQNTYSREAMELIQATIALLLQALDARRKQTAQAEIGSLLSREATPFT
jgi:hypothetical protein